MTEVFPDLATAIFDSQEAIPVYNKGKKASLYNMHD